MSIFGPSVPLAKTAAEEITQDDATRTVVAHLTDPGTTGGTICLPEPEQARGQPISRPSPISSCWVWICTNWQRPSARFSATARLKPVAIIREDLARVMLTHAPERPVWV